MPSGERPHYESLGLFSKTFNHLILETFTYVYIPRSLCGFEVMGYGTSASKTFPSFSF